MGIQINDYIDVELERAIVEVDLKIFRGVGVWKLMKVLVSLLSKEHAESASGLGCIVSAPK